MKLFKIFVHYFSDVLYVFKVLPGYSDKFVVDSKFLWGYTFGPLIRALVTFINIKNGEVIDYQSSICSGICRCTIINKVLWTSRVVSHFHMYCMKMLYIWSHGHIWPSKKIIKSLFVMVKTNNYANKCVWKTLLTMSVTMEYSHLLITYVVEHVELPIYKMNTPMRKEFPLAPIKKFATLVSVPLS